MYAARDAYLYNARAHVQTLVLLTLLLNATLTKRNNVSTSYCETALRCYYPVVAEVVFIPVAST